MVKFTRVLFLLLTITALFTQGIAFAQEPRGWIPPPNPDKAVGPHPGQIKVAEPIDVGSGTVTSEIADYSTAGPDRLTFTRYYCSHTSDDPYLLGEGMLGTSWASNFDRYIIDDSSDGTVVGARRPNGQTITFTQVGKVWNCDPDMPYLLQKNSSGWVFTDLLNGTVESYLPSYFGWALVSTIRERNGYTQTLAYDADGDLVSVSDSHNRKLSLAYTGYLLTSVTTPDATTISYGYDWVGAIDRLKFVTYSGTPSTTLTYLHGDQDPRKVTGIVDEKGQRYTSFTHAREGTGTSSQLGAGASLTTIAYSHTDLTRTVTLPLGEQDFYTYQFLQGVPKIASISRLTLGGTGPTKTFSYDAHGYLAMETDWKGVATKYTNDAEGRQSSIVEAAGTPNARTTTFIYWGTSNLPLAIQTPVSKKTFTYDSPGNMLTKTITDTTTGITKGTSRTWHYSYLNGLLASSTTPNGATTTYTYVNGALSSVTNPLGQKLSFPSLTAGGLPLKMVDPNGVVTTFTYDARQRLLATSTSTSNGLAVTTRTYDLAGNLVSLTLPDGTGTKMTYDAAHRLIATQDIQGNKENLALDAAGDRIQTVYVDTAGIVRQNVKSAFDSLGRLISHTGGAGQVTSYTYDDNGNRTGFQNGLGHTSMYGFDALDRLTRATDPLLGVIQTTLSALDQPTTYVDPRGTSTAYSYDGFGDTLTVSSPDAGPTTYQYDLDGNQVQRVDANGTVAILKYDALDRLKSVTYPSDAAQTVTYTYDQAGHGFGIGRVTTIKDAAGVLSLTYDELGNVIQQKRVIGAVQLTTAFQYNLANRLVAVTYPSGLIVRYWRDAAGNVASITAQMPGSSQASNLVTNLTYLPFGPLKAQTFGNGISEARTYDGGYRLVHVTAIGAKTLQNDVYSYDAADNVTGILDGVTPANNQTLGYDVLERLIAAKGRYGSLSYTYDPAGNRLQTNAGSLLTSYVYGSSSNRLLSLTSGLVQNPVTSNANGSITNINGLSLTYNAAQRLSQATVSGHVVGMYRYDASGQRISKVTAAGTTIFQYGQNGQLLEETMGTAAATKDYVYLDDGRLIASILPATSAVDYVLTDRIGTPKVLTDSHQGVAWSASFTPFGEVVAMSGSVVMNIRLPGQYFDSETGLYQNRFRDYAPEIGRYVESDPIGLTAGPNTFAYGDLRPVNNFDPLGLCPSEADWRKAYDEAKAIALSLLNVAQSLESPPSSPQIAPDLKYIPTKLALSNAKGAEAAGRLGDYAGSLGGPPQREPGEFAPTEDDAGTVWMGLRRDQEARGRLVQVVGGGLGTGAGTLLDLFGVPRSPGGPTGLQFGYKPTPADAVQQVNEVLVGPAVSQPIPN